MTNNYRFTKQLSEHEIKVVTFDSFEELKAFVEGFFFCDDPEDWEYQAHKIMSEAETECVGTMGTIKIEIPEP